MSDEGGNIGHGQIMLALKKTKGKKVEGHQAAGTKLFDSHSLKTHPGYYIERELKVSKGRS